MRCRSKAVNERRVWSVDCTCLTVTSGHHANYSGQFHRHSTATFNDRPYYIRARDRHVTRSTRDCDLFLYAFIEVPRTCLCDHLRFFPSQSLALWGVFLPVVWLLKFCYPFPFFSAYRYVTLCYRYVTYCYRYVTLLPAAYITRTNRGHPYKLYNQHSSCAVRSPFFSERVVNIWNSLPVDTVFSSLPSLTEQINRMDFLEFKCTTGSF